MLDFIKKKYEVGTQHGALTITRVKWAPALPQCQFWVMCGTCHSEVKASYKKLRKGTECSTCYQTRLQEEGRATRQHLGGFASEKIRMKQRRTTEAEVRPCCTNKRCFVCAGTNRSVILVKRAPLAQQG